MKCFYCLCSPSISSTPITAIVDFGTDRIWNVFLDLLGFPDRAAGSEWLLAAFLSVWLCGFAGVVIMGARACLSVRTALRASAPVEVDWGVSVRSSSASIEPGVVGVFRPTLLLPDGIVNRLPRHPLAAVVAHELCHVRRRDNLTSMLHMITEANP